MKNPEEKYDVIPEIWQGHNVADFIDPDIMEVCVTAEFYVADLQIVINKMGVGLND